VKFTARAALIFVTAAIASVMLRPIYPTLGAGSNRREYRREIPGTKKPGKVDEYTTSLNATLSGVLAGHLPQVLRYAEHHDYDLQPHPGENYDQ
jgi:hypothetical protein